MWAEEVAVPLRGRGVGAFLGWALLGAGIGFGFGAVLVVGLVAALALLAVGGVLVARQGLRPAQLGVISGLGVLPLTIAWLNRHGPGEYCTTTAVAESQCVAQWSPWPFALVGLALVVVGVLLFVRTRRA
ncbi:hypothetical protein [Cellulomonas sp. ICMP 17802]|uniref:hypothetical protein n=1 Tax=Cellulomonas sp. ICMP 17802 TaxID=3239199 RepID=UPI00351AEC02